MRDPFSIINKITEIATKEIKSVNIDLGYGFSSPAPAHPFAIHIPAFLRPSLGALSLASANSYPSIFRFVLSFFVLFPNFVLFLYFIGILSRMLVDAQFYDCAHTQTHISHCKRQQSVSVLYIIRYCLIVAP